MSDKDKKSQDAQPQKPDMTDWDDAPKPELMLKSLDKKRIVNEKK